ncbi:hypothetical protein B0H13DRAFT_1007212, partial [Mycena leptocephala]
MSFTTICPREHHTRHRARLCSPTILLPDCSVASLTTSHPHALRYATAPNSDHFHHPHAQLPRPRSPPFTSAPSPPCSPRTAHCDSSTRNPARAHLGSRIPTTIRILTACPAASLCPAPPDRFPCSAPCVVPPSPLDVRTLTHPLHHTYPHHLSPPALITHIPIVASPRSTPGLSSIFRRQYLPRRCEGPRRPLRECGRTASWNHFSTRHSLALVCSYIQLFFHA